MLEVRLHGRGGQGVQVACQILAGALFRSGRHVQAFAAYGGERRGAPVTAFVREDHRPIWLRCDIERPHHLVVFDPSVLDDGQVAASVRPGGLVVVNSRESTGPVLPEGIRLVAIDAAAIARRVGLGAIVSTAMVGAFCGAAGIVTLEALLASVEEGSPARASDNVRACTIAYLEAAGLETAAGLP
jgi:2-oxoacid:acceptor oxidoreductase gamma subunit (pyruvate/2-ketoisovalerate family)